jgi:glycerol-3-phosphate dehydrogenase
VEAERQSQRMPDDATADAARLGAPDVRGFAADRGIDWTSTRQLHLPG